MKRLFAQVAEAPKRNIWPATIMTCADQFQTIIGYAHRHTIVPPELEGGTVRVGCQANQGGVLLSTPSPP